MKKILVMLLTLILVLSFSGCQNVPKPQIEEGEFPFEIIYEIDGKTVTVNDVYVCDFDGFGWNEGVGKHRKWKGYIKSTGKDELILLEDGDLTLACSVGSPEYYMDDSSETIPNEYTPSIYYIKPNEFGGTSSGITGIEPILEQYKIRLVSWNLSKPIENTFE